ncbi:NAD(P)H-binding [Lutibacter agarilyticus]|uniref:NAD(P)H-binding n=1 Tax=Lutibacter agarilyticus TaxID=1109740 RepID=A0A238W5S4_9FLAO|nr:NAD(P)H-binding protein [Lutibacter agarilyticus]SNR41767.1 NAD(P)H-binding [Lutibacter agarilyticus]
MGKTAIILGASGLTGSILLNKLLKDERYKSIKLFSRKKIDGLPSKVIQFTGNLLELENFKADFTGDEVYCCIGTTAKKTPDKTMYKAIDFGIPVAAAKLSKKNGINTFLVVSALGANANSSIFYNKTKGEMEQAVLAEKIEKTHILQPSIIGGDRKETRIGEKIGLVIFKLLQPLFFGKLKKYRLTEADHIAQAMINLANSTSTTQIITSEKIKEIAIN